MFQCFFNSFGVSGFATDALPKHPNVGPSAVSSFFVSLVRVFAPISVDIPASIFPLALATVTDLDLYV